MASREPWPASAPVAQKPWVVRAPGLPGSGCTGHAGACILARELEEHRGGPLMKPVWASGPDRRRLRRHRPDRSAPGVPLLHARAHARVHAHAHAYAHAQAHAGGRDCGPRRASALPRRCAARVAHSIHRGLRRICEIPGFYHVVGRGSGRSHVHRSARCTWERPGATEPCRNLNVSGSPGRIECATRAAQARHRPL